MHRLALVVASVIACTGCKEVDPTFCSRPENFGQGQCPDAPTLGGPCKSSTNCTSTPNFPVCDLMVNGGTCVLCTADDHAACTGLTPHCEDHACVACVDDNDCDAGAGVCLPTGGCADPSSIIHTKSTSVLLTQCGGMATPCSLEGALVIAKSGSKVIKLDDPGPYLPPAGTNYSIDVDASMALTIDARNATIHHNGSGAIFTINDGKGMTLLGGTIEQASGGSAEGIRCGNNAILTAYGTTIQMNDGLGINAPNGCTLTLSRSRIASNRGGGLTITDGKFVIVGNMFLNNGDANAQKAGVTISTTPDNTNRFEFNTIANNAILTGAAMTAGVDCRAGPGFTASHNIIWNNMIGGNASTVLQVFNTCMHSHSIIGPVLAVGTGNSNGDPLLTSDGHLSTGSSASQKAEPEADLSGLASRDIDGDRRVAPADLGADQISR